MAYEQEHLPRNKPATPEQEWGFAFEDFLEERWPYLVAIAIVLAIFFYARHNWRQRQKK